MIRSALVVFVLGCGSSAAPPKLPAKPASDVDPTGAHKAQVAAQIQPMIDAEMATSIVVGLYDAGKREIYGFGKGPGGKPPTGSTLYEIGSVAKVYTSLLLADAVQRREVALDTPVSALLPPGITVPTKDEVAITLGHLALHTSGLPRLPPSLMQVQRPDPYGGYGEEALYRDLLATMLEATPGTRVVYSNYGAGLLGFALGKKIGGGYAAALRARVLEPLGLKDTYVGGFPPGAPRAEGTNDDLEPTAPWTFDALAGAGGLVSSARDQLAFIDAQLDAAAGGKLALRPPMRLTQEVSADAPGENSGLGWVIDSEGRYWHNGGTGGYHAYVGFDPKTRRGVVLLSSTSTALIDLMAPVMYALLDGKTLPGPTFPTTEQLAALAGTYDLLGEKLQIEPQGKRLYMRSGGEERVRLLPISFGTVFFIEALQARVTFVKDGDKVTQIEFDLGGQKVVAPRVP